MHTNNIAKVYISMTKYVLLCHYRGLQAAVCQSQAARGARIELALDSSHL